MNLEKAINDDLLRCHLGALVHMCGDQIPPGMNAHPDLGEVESSKLPSLVDKYRAFLRSLRSVDEN